MYFNFPAILRAWSARWTVKASRSGIRKNSRLRRALAMAPQAEPLEQRLVLTPDIYLVPGDPTQQINLTFDLTQQETKFKNEIGVFVVDGPSGAVDGHLPGTADYARAAMHSTDRHVLFPSGGHPGVSEDLTFAGGTYLAFYLVKKHSSELLLSRDHHTKFPHSPKVYFSSEDVSHDHFDHAHSVVLDNGSTEFQWKDSKKRKQPAYDDAVYTITATTTLVAPTVHLVNDTGISSADRLTSDPTVTGTADPATSVLEAFIETNGSPQIHDITSTLSNGTFTLTLADLQILTGQPLNDGTYTLDIRSRDGSGNVSATGKVTFTLDTTTPQPTVTLSHDTGTSGTDDVTSDATLQGTASDANGIALLEVAFATGGTPVYHDITSQLSNGVFNLDPAELATLLGATLTDGEYHLLVRATDRAGNVSDPAAVDFTLDSTVAAPVVALSNDTGISSTDRLTSDPTVQGTVADAIGIAGLEAAFTVGASTVFHDITDKLTDGNFTLTAADLASVLGASLVDGTYQFQVRARDVAGNVSNATTLSFNLDTSVNAASVALTNDTGVSNVDRLTSDPTIQGTVTDSNGVAAVEVAFDVGGAPVFHDITDKVTNGNFTLSSSDLATILGSSLSDGNYRLLARTRDAAGNISADTALSFTFTLDTTVGAPTLTLANDTGVSNSDRLTSDPTVQGTATDPNGVAALEAAFDLGATPVFHDVTNRLIAGSYTLTAADLAGVLGSSFVDGDYRLLIQTRDNAGNVSGVTALVFTLDTTLAAPTASLANDTGASNTDRLTSDPTIQGTAADSRGITRLEAAFDVGAPLVFHDITNSLSSGSYLLTPADLAVILGTPLVDGNYRFIVRAQDAAGNVSSDTVLTFTLAPEATVGTVTLALANDTGSSNTDRLTSDPTIAGTASATNGVPALDAAFDTGSTLVFHDISGPLNNGSFTLSPASLTTIFGSPLVDGDYRLIVRTKDNAGSVTGTNVLTFTLDTIATIPTAALVSDTGSNSTDRLTSNAAVQGTATDLHGVVSLEAAFDLGGVPTFHDVTSKLSNGTYSLTAADLATALGSPLVDGVYHLLVRERDSAGNLSANATLAFTLDTTVAAPGIALADDTGNSNSDKLTSDPTVNGTTTDLNGIASVEAAFDLGGNPVFHDVTNEFSNGAFTLTSADLTTVLGATLADGIYHLLVHVRDKAGNLSASTSLTFTLDKTIAPPTAGLLNDTGVSNIDRLTSDPTIQGAASDLHGIVALEAAFDKGTPPVFQDVTASLVNGVYTLTPANLSGLFGGPLVDGTYKLLVRARDAAGNVSGDTALTLTFTLDTAVAAPALSLANDTGASNSDGLTFDPTVSGTVADAHGIAALEAAFDIGPSPVFHNVTSALSNGSFTLTLANLATVLGSSLVDGNYRLLVRVRDAAGNLSTNTAIVFTLDTTVAVPTLALTNDTGVSNIDHITSDPTVNGTASDTHGPVTLEAAFDQGGPLNFQDVTSKLINGNYTLNAGVLGGLLGGAFPSGTYHVVVRVHDGAGNVASNNLTFTFDSVAPATTVDSPAPNTTVTQNISINGHVTDNLSGVAGLQIALDNGAFSLVSINGAGNFSFTSNLAVDGSANGLHTIHLRATDKAGNVAPVTDFPFTLQASSGPPSQFVDWTSGQVGGTGPGQGTVTFDTGATLIEGNSFNVSLSKTLTVPSQPSDFVFQFSGLNFDTTSLQTIKDAFEVAFVDANGKSLLQTNGSHQDAYFNISEAQSAAFAPGANVSNGTVTVTLIGLAPGTTGTLIFRLVNNDHDTTTSVHLDSFDFQPTTATAPPLSIQSQFAGPNHSAVDFTALSDVTSSFTADYGRTTFDDGAQALLADLKLTNSGTYTVDAPLIVVIRNISDPSVFVTNADGTTPDGDPYFNFSSLFANHVIPSGAASQSHTLMFHDAQDSQFTYDLEVLSQLNRAPEFTSQPKTEAVPGRPYAYQATATDPDGDAVSFSLLSGPNGMAVNANTGIVTWSPQASDLGNQDILLQVSDGHGGIAVQHYTLATIVAPPNRPPVFTSTPNVDGNVDAPFTYQATATDADEDTLTFSVVRGPVGLAIDASSGDLTWTPTASELGDNSVTLQVSDGHSGSATQTFTITIQQSAQNHGPLITSDPVTQYNLPPVPTGSEGNVDPTNIDLTLDNGETSDQNVSITSITGGPITLNSTINGVLGMPGERDVYTFSLANKSLLYFDAVTNNFRLEWTLTGPAGTVVSSRSFTQTDASATASDPVFSVPAGNYTLTITGSGQVQGPYSFRLANLAQAPTLTPGTPISETLDVPTATHLYQFAANAGDKYQFTATGNEIDLAFVRLIDPYGQVLVNNFLSNGVTSPTLLATGTYTLLVEGSIGEFAQGSYTLNSQFLGNTPPAPPAGTLLTLGTEVDGNLATVNQQDKYHFHLASDSRLYFDSLTTNLNIRWSLTGPTGTVINNLSFAGSDANSLFGSPVISVPAGDWTVTISAISTPVGAYAFRLSDLTAGTTIVPGTPVSDTLNPANSSKFYEFNATAGQSYYFARLSGTGGSNGDRWRLIDPFGNLVFSDGLSVDKGRFTLNTTGTYTILVEGQITDTGTVNYGFNVIPINDSTQALTLGNLVSSTLSLPGEQDNYTFHLSNDSQVYFDSLTNDVNILWTLTGPPVTVVNNRPFNASDSRTGPPDPVLLLPAGDYNLKVFSPGPTTGAYSFRLSDLATSSQTISLGTTVNGTLNPSTTSQFYQFNATAGQTLYFAHLSDGGSGGMFRVIDPFGSVVFSNFLAQNPGRQTLPLTGTYRILIEGNVSDGGSINYSYSVSPVVDTTQPLTLNSIVNGTLAGPGELDNYTFNLASDTLLYFDALTNNANLQWMLKGPAGTVISNRTFNSTDSFFTTDSAFPVIAGSYTLTLSGVGQTVGGYSFRLSNLSAVTPLTPGTPVSGTLNPANASNLYRFTAAAGQSFFFDSISGTPSGAGWRLVDPFGRVMFRAAITNDAGRQDLPVSGTYTVIAEGALSDTTPVDYSFNVVPITDVTQPLTLGSLVSSSLAGPGEQDHYTFDLASTTRVYLDVLTNNNNLNASLAGPYGAIYSGFAFNGLDGTFAGSTPILSLPAGLYSLTIAGAGATAGAYSFRLSDVSTATPLTPGTPVSNTLNPANSSQLYQFTATAGQSFYFAHLSGGGASADWKLVDPFGNMLFQRNLTIDPGRLTLNASGTYTILAEGSLGDTGTTPYSFNVIPISDTTPALTVGSTINGTLSAPSQLNRYTFTLATNSKLFFDSLTNNAGFVWSLSGPAGPVIANEAFNGSDANFGPANSVLALPAGAYTLTVTSTGQTAGGYSFKLSDFSTATVLTPGTATNGTLNPANSANLYQLSATAGDQFNFTRQTSTGVPSASWRLIDPYGNVVFRSPLTTNNGPVTLGFTGTYDLIIEGATDDTVVGTYTVTAQFLGNVPPTPPAGTALSLNTNVSGNLTVAGQQDRYVLNLAADDQLYFDALTNTGNLNWALTGPTGTIISSRSFTNSDGVNLSSNPTLSVPAGVYTLTISAANSATGAYAFRLDGLSSASPLTPGTAVNGTLTVPNGTNFYQFQATAGQSFYFAHVSNSGGLGNETWKLISPYGHMLFGPFLNADAGRVTLPETGTYTVLVEGSINDTTPTAYSFNVIPISDTSPSLTLGSVVNGNFASAGQRDTYSFNVAIGTRLYFDALTNNAGLNWTLAGPAGTLVSSRAFNGTDAAGFSQNIAIPAPAGPYTLTITGTGQTSGGYSFKLSDMTTATPLTPGTPVNGSLTPGNSTNLYQFQATAGQSFYFARLSSSGGLGSEVWRLIDPNGQMLFDTFFNTDGGRFTFPVGGTYTVLVEGPVNGSATANYSFNVAPITDTTQPLTLGNVTSGTLQSPGQLDRYTFTLASAAQLNFDSLTNSGSINWTLVGPTGTLISARNFNGSDANGINVPDIIAPAGTYTLTVGGAGQTVGGYSYRLSDLATATPFTPGNVVNVSLTPANSTKAFSFAATAGQAFYFAHLTYTGGASADLWRLVDPYGVAVFGTSLGTEPGRLTLNVTGTYTLLVEGGVNGTGTTNFSFNVLPAVDKNLPLNLNSDVQGQINGQQDHYTFTLASPTNLYFDSRTNNANLQWVLSGPYGIIASGRAFNGSDAASIANPLLPVGAGTYTLTVFGVGQATGAYEFSLEDLAAAQHFEVNTQVPGQLLPGNSTNLHSFTAQAGDSVYFESQFVLFGITPVGGRWRLVDPFGNILFIATLGQDAGRFTLPATGTYTVMVEGLINNTANAGYVFKVDLPRVVVVPSDLNVPFQDLSGPSSNLANPSFNVQLQGNDQTQVFELRFEADGTGIEYGSIPVSINAHYYYQVRALDQDGDTLTYSLPHAPAGMQIDPVTGLITWTPTLAQIGTNTVTVQVDDGQGGVTTQDYVLTVTNQTPGGIEGTVFNDLDSDGARSSFGLAPLPPAGPFQSIGTPFPAIGFDIGPAMIITIGPGGAIDVTTTGQGPYDGEDDTYVAVINLATSGVAVQSLHLFGDVPIFAFDGDGISAGGAGHTGYEGPGTYFTHYDGSIISVDDNEDGFPAGTLSNGNVNFEDGLGNGLQPGQETYFSLEEVPSVITPNIVKQALALTVEPPIAGATVYLDLNQNGQLDANEPSSITDSLGHYSFSNLIPGHYTVAEVGRAGIEQTGPASGTYAVNVLAGKIATPFDFGNKVIGAPDPRPISITSIAPTTGAVDQLYRYPVVVNNPDNVDLHYDFQVKPEGMLIDPETGVIVWKPTLSQVGVNDVVLRVQDDRGEVVLQRFRINVGLEAAPVITSTPVSPAITGLPYRYQVQAQDAENDPLTYSLIKFPIGMTIDPATGVINWVGAPIGPGLPGGYEVHIQVSDGRGGVADQDYTLFVVADTADHVPVINSSPRTITGLAARYYYHVDVTDSDGDPLTFTLTSAPAGMSIDGTGLIRWQPTAAQLGSNPVSVKVDDGRGGIVTQDFTITVQNQTPNQAPAIVSTPFVNGHTLFPYGYVPLAIDPDGDVVVWSLDTAPFGMSVDADTGVVQWTPNVNQVGDSKVVLRATDSMGASTTQAFTITVRAGNSPPLVTSNPPSSAFIGVLYSYAIAAQDRDHDTLAYSLVTAPQGMSIDPATGLVQWSPTAAQTGLHDVAILVDDGRGGHTLQTYRVAVEAFVTNQPPSVTSTPPFSATVSQTYSYQATATDPEGETLHYTLTTFPGGMTVNANTGLIQWTPDVAQLGPNQVVLKVTDPEGAVALQRFTLTVLGANQSPTINSTAIRTATAGAVYHYDVQATDPDGEPVTLTLTTHPAGMSIDSRGRITWSPAIGDIGPHSVVVTAADPRGGTATQTYTLTVAADTAAPQVDLFVSESPANLGDAITVVVSASDNVGVTGLTLTNNGVPVPLDAAGRAIITPNAAGQFALIATARDAAGNVGSANENLLVIDPNVTAGPNVDLTSPTDGSMVTAPTSIIGSVQDPNLISYTLSYALLGSDHFIDFFTSTSQVNNGVLGTLDPTLLQNDTYILRLTAINTGGFSSSVETTFNVSQNLKLGNFSLTFTDLTVPVAGIPITVARTYNSFDSQEESDFGFGWSLAFRDVNLRTSVEKTGAEADGFFNPFQFGTHVYVTLPGGSRQGFTFQPKVADGLRGSFIGIFEPVFAPDPGVTSSLTVPAADLRIADDGSVYDFTTGEPYNPASGLFGESYLLTTQDGLAYGIDGLTGDLTTITDSNDNELTFTDSGITSSTGVGVTFHRDAQGRIASVTDPMGKSIGYQYDAHGDLVAVADRTGNTTQFDYLQTPAHYLQKVTDPLGNTGIRTEYDDHGRLIKVIDAAGNPVTLSYDPANLVATVTDQLGKQVIEEYDDRGNILSQTDALGGVTQRTYDSKNNMLTETDPLGHTTAYTYDARGQALSKTDALGNTTYSTYHDFTFGTTALAASRGQAAPPFSRTSSTTDALGNTTNYSYDFFGNLNAVTNPDGTVSGVAYAAGGRLGTVTDATGATTHYDYDNAGRVIQQIDQLGHATTYTYDANGNQLTETTTQTAADGSIRTLTTTTTYDDQGHVLTQTDAVGDTTHFEYDAAGNKTAMIDALGHRTEYRYDARGLLIETILPDNTPGTLADNPRTSVEYDAARQVVARVDELGRRTEYRYDALGRLTATIYPDDTPANLQDNPTTHTEYDANGQVTAQVDELGNRTEYTYDLDGNVISVKDALAHITHSTFDAAGRQSTVTDELGHTTQFIYDSRGLLIETDYADGTKTTRTLDDRGEAIAITDQAGRTTHYEYDNAGRLTAVVDVLNQRTEYTYDELGDRISQQDADNHTTKYEYDGLGRLTATVLPMGQRSEVTYNAVGNVASTTDGNGATINFVYDERNQLVTKDYPGATSVQYTYTSTGRIATEVDARGTTHYAYDERNRLLSQIDPDGTTISYTYDAAGNQKSVTTPAGATNYTFDQLNRLSTVTDPDGNATTYTYDAASNLTITELPDGTVEHRTYDSLNRLTFLQTTGPSGVISSYAYTLALTGRRDSVTENTGRKVEYTYDALDRLTQEKITDAVNGNRTISYTYDPAGNRLIRTDSDPSVGLSTYTYDANDRLATETDQGVLSTYAYDANGNTLSKTTGASHVSYTWDFDNRLTDADTNGDGITDEHNVYDAAGNRVSQTVNGQETRFLLDVTGPLAQVLLEYKPGGQISVSYAYGNGLVSQERGGVVSVYHVDGLGSTRALTNVAGQVTDQYIFDAFGRMISQVGTTVNSYLFAGQQRDATLGLDYLRARFMNPATGRFASADSFPGVIQNPLTLNHYIYTGQNPVNFVDPTGHFFDLIGGAVATAIDEAIELATSALEFKSFIDTARGVEDLLFLAAFGAEVATFALISGFEDSFTIAAQEEDPTARVRAAEFKFQYQKGQDPVLALEVELKQTPKFTFKLNLRHPDQFSVEVGQEFHVNIANITAEGVIPVLALDLVFETQAYPSLSFKASIEGKFGPGGLLKSKFTLVTVAGSGLSFG